MLKSGVTRMTHKPPARCPAPRMQHHEVLCPKECQTLSVRGLQLNDQEPPIAKRLGLATGSQGKAQPRTPSTLAASPFAPTQEPVLRQLKSNHWKDRIGSHRSLTVIYYVKGFCAPQKRKSGRSRSCKAYQKCSSCTFLPTSQPSWIQ